MTSESESNETDNELTCVECDGEIHQSESNFDVFCLDCGLLYNDTRDQNQNGTDPWSYHFENPSEYWNSGTRRCIGGFPHAYEWVRSDEVDGPVADVDPDTFYK